MTDNEIKKALEWVDQFENNIIFKGNGDERCSQALKAMAVIKQALKEHTCLKRENVRARAKVNHFQYLHDVFTTTPTNRIKAEAVKEFEKKLESRLIELYEKYHKIANKPKKETDMFYQGRAEAIWECINTNRNLVKEMVGEKGC